MSQLQRAAYALIFLLFAGASASARADDLADASKLLRAGQHQQAMERVNKVLAAKPADPQARFLKGLIHTEQGNTQAAIDVFQKLTVDYPELPEPYNNLAVIYASQGQYDKARVALEQSIRTHPSYATAYENLGDVYARLASQAYDRALKLDSTNAGAQNKLALVRDLVGSAPTRDAAPTLAAAAQKAAPAPEATPAKSVAPAAPKQVQPTTAAKAAAQPATTGVEGALDAVKAWANAWSRKDVDAYLAAYAKEFRTPKGEPRGDWERGRRERLTAPKSIDVQIEDARVKRADDGTVSVTFRQEYRSDVFSGSATKTLQLVKSDDGRWRILREQVSN